MFCNQIRIVVQLWVRILISSAPLPENVLLKSQTAELIGFHICVVIVLSICDTAILHVYLCGMFVIGFEPTKSAQNDKLLDLAVDFPYSSRADPIGDQNDVRS